MHGLHNKPHQSAEQEAAFIEFMADLKTGVKLHRMTEAEFHRFMRLAWFGALEWAGADALNEAA
jgi:hypothetical protein